MTKPDAITQNLLAAVADLHDVPSGAYNLRRKRRPPQHRQHPD